MNGKNHVKVDITADPSGLKKGTEEARRDLEKLGAGHAQAAQATQKHTSMALEFIKGLAGYDILKAAASHVANLAKETSLLAARNETLGVVLQVVGRNIGLSGAEMDAYAARIKAMGITTLASQESVVRMVQAQMDLAGASDLARVAQDAAVIGNVNSSEAFQRLVYAIQSAQPEMLRVIGLNVNFERGYARMAEQIGKTVDELTEAEKVQIRTNLVLEAGTRITGAYEGAMGTAGKQLTSLARYTEDLKVIAGQTFNEALVIGVSSYTSALKDAGTEAEKLARDGTLKEFGRDTIRVFAFVGDSVIGAWHVIRTTVEQGVLATLRSMNVLRKGAIDMFPGGRFIREMAGRASGVDIDAYIDSFAGVANENLAERLGRRQFRDEAEAFFAQQDRDAAARAATRGVRPPRPAGNTGGAIETAAQRKAREKEQQRVLESLVESAELAQEAADSVIYTWDEAGNRLEIPFQKAEKAAKETFSTIREDGKQTWEEMQFAVEGWGRENSRALARMAVDGRFAFSDLKNAARGFLEELIAIQIQSRFMRPALAGASDTIDRFLNPMTGYGFGADGRGAFDAELHAGGIAGYDGRPRRVHPMVFAGAPRMHRGGLAHDEVPAILQRGEEVLTRRDPRHRANGGDMPTVIVNVMPPPGMPVTGRAAPPRFEGGRLVVDLLLEQLSVDQSAADSLKARLAGPQHY